MTDIRTDKSFEVPATPPEAWKALEGVRAKASGLDEWWLPGFACRGAEVDVEAPHRLTVRKLDEPCAGTLITVTFEHTGTGSRVRVVQSGFDAAFVAAGGEAFWTHADHLAADLHLFLATGADVSRAWRPWAPLGVGATNEPFGLRVEHVQPGSWADRVGVRAHDVLLTIAGAPLYDPGELGVVERIVHAGDEITATWARDGDCHEATATV